MRKGETIARGRNEKRWVNVREVQETVSTFSRFLTCHELTSVASENVLSYNGVCKCF